MKFLIFCFIMTVSALTAKANDFSPYAWESMDFFNYIYEKMTELNIKMYRDYENREKYEYGISILEEVSMNYLHIIQGKKYD
jgi:hypothetical protein